MIPQGAPESAGLRALSVARDWVGTPYQHQASVRGAGTDCLGLLRGIWRRLYGCEMEPIPPYTADWAEPAHSEMLWLGLRRHLVEVTGAESPGQLLLFRMRAGAVAKHLGILSRTGRNAAFIHAYTGHGVVESPLPAPWRRRIVARFQFPEGAR
ncbi:peptidase [Paenirhodobacter sp. CAU 1674]|jgi:NlpC/P60 family putative phage cell wall peptidase|uniref:peptidase n=1 Tax=Paenirhodobacter sp. CAU 1674 TaxID=3032596 RepID=UPI0023D9DD39|nr:peptidase [Paenirhodobacter sp. CAU 1674]MDF2142388.1 peptidase [Paenirhodobacter sp. CAU 1674]